jgi:hypothetical protein
VHPSQPIHLFLNDALVDEVWMSIKRDGIETERVKEATAKVSAKAKFGLGKLWSWLASDLNMEINAAADITHTTTLQSTSFLRALLIPELLENVVRGGNLDQDLLKKHRIGTFVNFECTHSHLVPIPTMDEFLRQRMVIDAAAAMPNSDPPDSSRLFELIEKQTSLKKAMVFSNLLEPDDDAQPSQLGLLFNELTDEFTNAMIMSNNDQVLFLSTLTGAEPAVFVISFLAEEKLRRNLAGFTGNRPATIFGKLASRRHASDGTPVVGIDAISISLN